MELLNGRVRARPSLRKKKQLFIHPYYLIVELLFCLIQFHFHSFTQLVLDGKVKKRKSMDVHNNLCPCEDDLEHIRSTARMKRDQIRKSSIFSACSNEGEQCSIKCFFCFVKKFLKIKFKQFIVARFLSRK